MTKQNMPILTHDDFQKLTAIVKGEDSSAVELLEDELSRAAIVSNENLPDDVVSMNSKIRFQDMETGQEKVVTLVYPHEANILENKISILAPVGSALLGLREGQVIRWPVPNGQEKQLKVISVLSQRRSA